MSWKTETFGSLLTESRIPCENPDIEKRIRVKLNVQGVEKRPVGAEKAGATKQFIRKAGQFIYGKQNFHKGAFGVIPEELDGFETSADIPSFDVREDCLPEWIYYFFKAGNRYLELTEFARGVGSQRIHPKQLQDLEIPLPPIDVQRKIIAELEIIEKDEISTELTHQLDLVKQLRQAFLREAMQGKLVPQDPNDEPASVLLEKIKAEKERLVKDKKIKKQKPLPPITEEDLPAGKAGIPFEIPENWVLTRIGEVCTKVTDGFHHTPKKLKEGKIYVSATHIREHGIDWANCQFIPEKDHNALFKKAYPQKGEILITNRGAGCATPAIIDIEEDFSFQNAALIGFNRSLISNRFLFYFILKNRDDIMEYFVNGGLQPMLSNVVLSKIPLPLPPLSEQQRIVAKLDELMAYCDALESSIKASQQQNEMLLQQVLREALEPETAILS